MIQNAPSQLSQQGRRELAFWVIMCQTLLGSLCPSLSTVTALCIEYLPWPILSLLPTTTLLALTPIIQMRKLGFIKVRKLVVTLLRLSNSRGYWPPTIQCNLLLFNHGEKITRNLSIEPSWEFKKLILPNVSLPCHH